MKPSPALLWRRVVAGFFIACLLAACQTPPPPAPAARGLTEAQIAALVKLGFIRADDGRSLNFDGRILFNTNTGMLTQPSIEVLHQITDVLKSAGVEYLRVEGHTDNVGSASVNQALSLKRAETVARELAEMGFPYSNISVIGLADTRPIADNSTEQGRLQNRRAAIIISTE